MPTWDEIKAGIFAGESGGDYNALFGFSNRPGGPFENVRLTDMTVDQAIEFSKPKGPYAQWVKNQIGRVATPMGGFQVVGTTLRQMKEKMGLTGSEQMTPALQDQIGKQILNTQGTDAWEGYRGPRTPGITLTSAPAQPGMSAPNYSVAQAAAVDQPDYVAPDGTTEVAATEEVPPKTWRESLTQDLAKDDDKSVLSGLVANMAKRRQADAEAFASFSQLPSGGGGDMGNQQNFQAAQQLMAALLQKKRSGVPGLSLSGMGGMV